MSVTVYKNAQFPNEKTTTNFVVEGTKFVQVGGDTSTFEKSADVKVVDLKGKLTIPPFADAHIHLDYVYTANLPTHETSSGTLFEAIDNWSESKSKLTVDAIKSRAYIAIKQQISHGV